MSHLLYGDSAATIKTVPTGSVQAVITDPPYNLNRYSTGNLAMPWRSDFNNDIATWDALPFVPSDWLAEFQRVLAPTGTLFAFTSYNLIGEWHRAFDPVFDTFQFMCWHKCLASGTLLYSRTPDGDAPRRVSDLARMSPNAVQLWNGTRWTRVLAWNSVHSEREGVEIELRSGEKITATREHRWPTIRGLIATEDLKIGDVIETTVLPEPDEPDGPSYLPDEDIGWLVGLYLAEGSIQDDAINFAGHVREVARFQRIKRLAEAYGGTSDTKNYAGQTAMTLVWSRIVVEIIKRYIGGTSAQTKYLKPYCWQRSNRFLQALLNGYLEGDGNYDEPNSRWRLSFCRNDTLARNLRSVCARLGYHLTLKSSDARLNGVSFPKYAGTICMTRTGHASERHRSEVIALKSSYCEVFWDVTVVDEPHTFALASGLLTHNSNPPPKLRRAGFLNSCELIVCCWNKGHVWNFTKQADMHNFIETGICQGKERLKMADGRPFPTQKPLAVLRRLVELASRPCDLVYDPFMGVGSSGEAALMLRRRFIGGEADAEAYGRAEERLRPYLHVQETV